MALSFDAVVAADEAGGIGKRGELPWKLPGDIRFFKEITSRARSALGEGRRNAVIMGRKTWDTVPPRYRPLDRRLNVVVTRNASLELPDGVLRADSIAAALRQLAHAADLDRVFVIGGGEIYRQAVAMPECRRVYLTRVAGRFDCDAFFPELTPPWRMVEASERHEENGIGYVFQTWEK